ncbi:tryptophan halogenase family protein [Massilia sp. TWP1-3-3]|uniref:tryptophan halogenase family protein n=1 Tax=Massilia sp. TWP1-3-3 TaxID=2804573 RepID=UPI003CE91E91
MKNASELKDIVIVGGGSAGWMSAMILADTLAAKGVTITVLESPTVGVIGVGEGSTPALKRFFDSLNIAESEWMPQCNATFKSGITFDGWSTKPGFGSYFHQFSTMVDKLTQPVFISNVHARLQGGDVDARPDDYFLSRMLVENKLAPLAGESFPFTATYGYHFDAALLGKFLHKKALERGVRYRVCHVTHATQDADGNIAAVHTSDGEAVAADLFIDCSGFSALLIDKTLKTPFVSYSDVLFNDAAVALPTPLDGPIAPQTVSTAMKYGWAWQIPLTNRYGNGYVYSTRYCDADQAETELRHKLGQLDGSTPARHLKMKIGRVAQHWSKNCVAVGLSQGFLEPLEATALYLTQMTVAIFALFLDKGDFSEPARHAYNQEVNGFFDGHRDYIVAHFKTSSRTDTVYWRDNASELGGMSDCLKGIFGTWLQAKDLSAELVRQDLERYYPVGSWYALMAGMGVFPAARVASAQEASGHAEQRAQMREFLRRCALNFRDHKLVLQEMVGR